MIRTSCCVGWVRALALLIVVVALVHSVSCGSSIANLFLPINPNDSLGQLCNGKFVTGDGFTLCRREADGALGAFDEIVEPLVVDAQSNVIFAGQFVIGHAEVAQTYHDGDPVSDVFWYLKKQDNALLRMDEMAALVTATDATTQSALAFVDDFVRFYHLKSNQELAATDKTVTYGIDGFLNCTGTPPADRPVICSDLYDYDQNGTLNSDDYVALVAIVESPEAADQIVSLDFNIYSYYACVDESNQISSSTSTSGSEETQTLSQGCLFFDRNGDGLVDQSDLLSLFNATDANENLPPVANAGADQTVVSGTEVMLDGSASADAESSFDQLRLTWEQIGGTPVVLSNADTAAPSFTAPSVVADTTLMFQLTVRDPGGLSNTDIVRITVVFGVTANAGEDQQVDSSAIVTLDGSESAGNELTYLWTQTTEGVVVTLSSPGVAEPVFVAPAVEVPTSLIFELTVTDVNGHSDTDSVVVTVLPVSDTGG